MCAGKETYYRELARTIKEAGKSQVLQGELISEDPWFSSSPRAHG